MVKLDESRPSNQGVLNQLKKDRGDKDPILPANGHPDPYMRLGSHPDIVSRVWQELGGALPTDCTAIVYGTPALVNPTNGEILALAYGTSYVIRVPVEAISAALKAGCKIEQVWAGGSKTNVQELFSKGWVFGGWSKDEESWILSGYNNLQRAT